MTLQTDVHPPPFVINPTPPQNHTHTLILLHGTSTSGPEFADSILNFPFIPSASSEPKSRSNSEPKSTQTLNLDTAKQTLKTALPGTKFVFPTGSIKKTTVFGGRETHAWFDIATFSDRTIGENAQIPGMRESVLYLSSVVEREIDALEKKGYGKEDARRRVVFGGFSQGCAMAVVLLLSGELERNVEGVGKIGGLVGMSGWLPFRRQISEIVSLKMESSVLERKKSVSKFLRELLSLDVHVDERALGIPDIPVLLVHGEKDEKVRLEWAMQMRDTLNQTGLSVQSQSYGSLEHWHDQDELRDVVDFLRSCWSGRDERSSHDSPKCIGSRRLYIIWNKIKRILCR